MKPLREPQEVAHRLIELLGGRDVAIQKLDESFSRVTAVWDRDSALIGRILRAHLFVEHFLGEYLRVRNPNLGAISDARLTYAQKLSLLDHEDPSVNYLIPGIRRLNEVRNRIAHALEGAITTGDRDTLLSIALFRELRRALFAPDIPGDDPLEVIEAFARHAGMTLASASSPLRDALARATGADDASI